MTRAYSPRGAGLLALNAMREEPTRLWSSVELAHVMSCTTNVVTTNMRGVLAAKLVANHMVGKRFVWGLPEAIAAFVGQQQEGEEDEEQADPPVFPDRRTEGPMQQPALCFTVGTSTRPGAMDAYRMPSCVGGVRIERTRPPLVLGSRVPEARTERRR